MRQNEDGKTVAAWTSCFPGIGEIVGRFSEKSRLDVLTQAKWRKDIPQEEMCGTLDTRRFGATHMQVFGLGFERMVRSSWVWGISRRHSLPEDAGKCRILTKIPASKSGIFG